MLQINPDTVQIVRKQYNFEAPGRIEEAVDLLEEWVKRQKHFVKKDFPRMYIETSLLTNKGSMEVTKQSLDQLCTFKTLKPNFFPRSITKENFTRFNKISIQALLPRLDKNHYRICIMQWLSDEVNSKFYESYFQYCTMGGEYCKMHDYNAGYVLVVDYRNINPFALVAKTNIMEIKQLYTVMSKGYGMRVKGIHILSHSTLLQPMMAIVKTIIGAKLAGRLQLHGNLDTLYNAIEKDILPDDYGGKEKPLKTLSDEWTNLLCSKDQVQFCLEMFEAKTEEAYRKANVFNENYIGMPGSFRALSVD